VPDENGHWIPSTSHEAIIPADLFNRVQEQLARRNKSVHYREILDHPLRGIARCAICGRVYTPYPKKGILYYGARCAKDCTNPLKSFNFDYLSRRVGDLICNLFFTEQELEEVDARLSTDIALLESKRLSKLDATERQKKRVREDLAYLNANRLMLLKTGVYTPETFVSEEGRLSAELNALKDGEDTSDVAMRQTVEDVIVLSELLKNVAIVYSKAARLKRQNY